MGINNLKKNRSDIVKTKTFKKTIKARHVVPPQIKRLISNRLGRHKNRRTEQNFLSRLFKKKVSGVGFQSEHVIGYEVLADGIDRNKDPFGKKIDAEGYAYQEIKSFHRAHIGTGTVTKEGVDGFIVANRTSKLQIPTKVSERTAFGFESASKSSDYPERNMLSYRASQRQALEDGNISTAVQLNQLDYAFMEGFQDEKLYKVEKNIANMSFSRMVNNMESVYFNKESKPTSMEVFNNDKHEMLWSRYIASTGIWPSKSLEAFEKLDKTSKSKINTFEQIKKFVHVNSE